MLSQQATEVLNILLLMSGYEGLEPYLVTDDKGMKWLPMSNMLNGHCGDIPEEFIEGLETLSDVLDNNLIDSKGQCSSVYYELKANGYTLWVTEKDSYGPLGCAIKNPHSDWSVSYG